jgi:hypothetical protein
VAGDPSAPRSIRPSGSVTEDAGQSWEHERRLVPRYVPEEARESTWPRCPQHASSPLSPERLLMQFHSGVYRPTTGTGEHRRGLPSDFGPLGRPRDPDSAYVIPLNVT